MEKRDLQLFARMAAEGPVNTASFNSGKKLIRLVFPSKLTHPFSFFVLLPAPNTAFPLWEKREGVGGGGRRSRKKVMLVVQVRERTAQTQKWR